MAGSQSDLEIKKWTTTVKISAISLEYIDKYIKMGLYLSRPAFIADSIRTALAKILKDVNLAHNELVKNGIGEEDNTAGIRNFIFDKYVVKQNYQKLPRGLFEQVSYSSTNIYKNLIEEVYKTYLGFENLHDFIELCIFMKFDEIDPVVVNLVYYSNLHSRLVNEKPKDKLDLMRSILDKLS